MSSPSPSYFSGISMPGTELAELPDQRRLEVRLAIPLRGVRRELSLGELARDRLDFALLIAERRQRPSHRGGAAGGEPRRPA